MLFAVVTLFATMAVTWGLPVHRRDGGLGNAFPFDPTQPNDCSPTGSTSDFVAIRIPASLALGGASSICAIAGDSVEGVTLSADGLLVDQAVSVVGICTFCGPDDIEVSPQLMGELTGSPDALTQPLPGAYVVQFNGNGDE